MVGLQDDDVHHPPIFNLSRLLRLSTLLVFALITSAALGNRLETILASGWRFNRGDLTGAEAVGFDDHNWATVHVPHTWNVEDGATGKPYYRGVGWYRLNLKLTPDLLKRKLFLHFGAATLVAKVYLNGRFVGEHKGGFAAFCLPISVFAKPGENELAVEVDSSLNPDVPPLSGDFTFYGGLTREVKLIALDKVGVTPLDDGGPGLYLTPTVSSGLGNVELRTLLIGDQTPTEARLVATLENSAGQVVGQSSQDRSIGESAETSLEFRLKSPHLWDGVKDPYLYHVRLRITHQGKLLDEVVQPLGFRSFRVDPARGLILNEKPYDLHGVDIHQGRPKTGWAEVKSFEDEDYKIVKEMGCTGVRMAHYQHPDHEVELCDKLGLGVWAELPLVNKVSDTEAFRENAAQQLRELVKQNYNHPSVLVWSLYNEPWVDKVKGEDEWGVTKNLVTLAHQMDPNRMVTGAMNWGPDNWLTWVGDLASQNHYWGWYNGTAEQWAKNLDSEFKQTKGRSFGISEYGAGASVIQHESPPKQPIPSSKWHPEEWQASVHEAVWPALEARPWLWCKFIWVMYDFASSGRNEGDHPGINDKGLVTADRKTRKDAFYYYKAQWSSEPFVYITSRRFNPRPTGLTELKIYSNQSSVEVVLDGRDLGLAKKMGEGVFVFDGVNLGRGSHVVEAKAIDKGKGSVTDKIAFTSA